jgi:hypothetical protein
MEITVVEKSTDEEPNAENPGRLLWKGGTDSDAESPLPASLLAAVFDIGRWYRVSDFSERWKAATPSDGGYVTEVAVRLLEPGVEESGGVTRRDLARILANTTLLSKSIVEESLGLARVFEPNLCNLWIRLD